MYCRSVTFRPVFYFETPNQKAGKAANFCVDVVKHSADDGRSTDKENAANFIRLLLFYWIEMQQKPDEKAKFNAIRTLIFESTVRFDLCKCGQTTTCHLFVAARFVR
jgi:hypothetical protein